MCYGFSLSGLSLSIDLTFGAELCDQILFSVPFVRQRSAEAATKHAPSFCCIRGWPSLFGIQAGWCCTWSWLATDLPPLFVPLGTNDSSDLVLAPYTCWYRFSSSSSESSKVAWVSSVSVPWTPDFPPQWMLRTRAEAFWAYAPLLGSASHPAPGLANQLQVKLRPHPGVFVDDLSATLLLY